MVSQGLGQKSKMAPKKVTKFYFTKKSQEEGFVASLVTRGINTEIRRFLGLFYRLEFKTRITRNKTRNSVSLVLCAPRLRPLSETDPGVSIQYSFNIHSCHAKVVLLTGLLTGTWLR